MFKIRLIYTTLQRNLSLGEIEFPKKKYNLSKLILVMTENLSRPITTVKNRERKSHPPKHLTYTRSRWLHREILSINYQILSILFEWFKVIVKKENIQIMLKKNRDRSYPTCTFYCNLWFWFNKYFWIVSRLEWVLRIILLMLWFHIQWRYIIICSPISILTDIHIASNLLPLQIMLY